MMAQGFKWSDGSNCSDGPRFQMFQLFKCVKDLNGSRFQIVQGFKEHKILNGSRVQLVTVSNSSRVQMGQGFNTRNPENKCQILTGYPIDLKLVEN